ncbi:MAG: glycosyltransferase family 4 protein [Opitutaceae bacterium]|nr:glycosyltransferase family 4 protein [Opitutaceae bacterium]
MRVAHLLRKYDPAEWGGTETAIERLTRGLAQHGVASIAYAPRLLQMSTAVDPLLAAGCAVRRFHAFLSLWGIPAERERQMIAVGGNVMSFDLIGSLAREPGLDVIHSHALGRLGAIARTVARARHLPYVLSIHGGAYDLPAAVRQELQRPAAGGWDWGKPLGLLLRTRHLFKDADAIVTCNPREAELIRERHPGRHVFVQPHGVPVALFAPDHRPAARAAFPAIVDRPVLLVPGRIDPVKNQDWLVAQAAELVQRHPRILVVLVGACTHREYGDALQARIAREGLHDGVLLAGKLPPGDPRLIGLFQEARAVVLPSLSETFGLVILEAWAAGTPVISSRTSGATALVKDGMNGFLFDLGRPASFHAAVNRLLMQPELAVEWGAAGRATVAAEYDTMVLAERMKRIYETLIDERHAHGHSARR